MAASLQRTFQTALHSLARTESLLVESLLLPPQLQRIAGEILLLRTATILENFLADYFRKLVCGAVYLDASIPLNFVRARSITSAEHLILTYGRRKPERYVKWLLISSITGNVRQVIDPTDHCLTSLLKFSAEIDAIRKIRNHIGHDSAGTKKEYLTVVRTLYGPTANAIPRADSTYSGSYPAASK
jgi:hypothetical protein